MQDWVRKLDERTRGAAMDAMTAYAHDNGRVADLYALLTWLLVLRRERNAARAMAKDEHP